MDYLLRKGDLILDASNEHWQNTQRRQGKLVAQGVFYVGMGVSGGYQAARRGPSMCPGGEDRALDLCMPLLKKVAARDAKGRPCVGRAGMGGAGHVGSISLLNFHGVWPFRPLGISSVLLKSYSQR